MSIVGNMVGCYSPIGQTFIIQDEDGAQFTGVVVDQLTVFDAVPSDVTEGKTFASDDGVLVGTSMSSLNIAFGDAEPSDTSKLWVRAAEPSKTSVVTNIDCATLPESCRYIASAQVDSKIYLFGGHIWDTYSDVINEFDATTQTIRTLHVTLPVAAQRIGAASVGNKIYVFGGYGADGRIKTISVFDTEDESITTLDTKLPTGTYAMAAVAVGSKVYLFGGYGGDGYLATINVFDPETEAITTLNTQLPTAMHSIGAVAIGSKIYLFGGNCGNDVYSTAIHVFDTETNTLSTLDTTLPVAINKASTMSVGTKVYLFGGEDADGHCDSILVFDPEDESITTLDVTLPVAAYGMGIGAANSNVYLFGGDSSASFLDTISVFDTTTCEFVPGAYYLQNGDVIILTAQEKNTFKLLNSDSMVVSVGVEGVYIGNENNCISAGVDAYLYNGSAWAKIV